MKEAMSMLEDVTEYLTDENLTDMANNLSRVLSKVQSTWLAQRLNAATQTQGPRSKVKSGRADNWK